MRRRTIIAPALAAAALLLVVITGCSRQGPTTPPPTTPLNEELGKKLFYDTNLSSPPGRACASCHEPWVGYTYPSS